MNNSKRSGLQQPKRVSVKQLTINKGSRIATSRANKCTLDRQKRNEEFDKRRGLSVKDCAATEDENAELSKSSPFASKDKESAFKEQFRKYLEKKDEKLAAERDNFAKHPPFYVGGKNVCDSGSKSRIPMIKSCITPRSKLPIKLNFNCAKVIAKTTCRQADPQNLKDNKQINVVMDKQETSVSSSSIKVSDDKIPLVISKLEVTPAEISCNTNTFNTQDNINISEAVNSNPKDVGALTVVPNPTENVIENTVNVEINDAYAEIPLQSPVASTSKNLLKLEASSDDNSSTTNVQLENVLEIRRSNRKSRYTGSFTAMAAASDGKRRRSRSIGGRTSIILSAKFTKNTSENVTEKLPNDKNVPLDTNNDDAKENFPPLSPSSIVPSSSISPLISGSLKNCASPTFIDSTPNMPSTSKRRKTMTPFELNVDLVKPPEISFNDSFTSPLKAPSSILKSSKKSHVGHKSVHFELSVSSSISFDAEILEDAEESENDILQTSSSSPQSNAPACKENKITQGIAMTENNNITQNNWVHVQTSDSNSSSFFVATSICVLCFAGLAPNFVITAAIVKNRNCARFRKNHFFIIAAFHSLFRGIYLLFYGFGSVLYALASLGWAWTAMRPWSCWTFVVNWILFAEYYNGFTILTLAVDRHISVSLPVKYAQLSPRLGWQVCGVVAFVVFAARIFPIYLYSSTYDQTWDYCIGISSVMSPSGVVVHRFIVCLLYFTGLLIYFHLMFVAHRKKSIIAAMSMKNVAVAVIPAGSVLKVKDNVTKVANTSYVNSVTKVESFLNTVKDSQSPESAAAADGVSLAVEAPQAVVQQKRRRRCAHTSLINVVRMIILSYTISTTFICILAVIDYDSPWAESNVIFYLMSFTLVISKLCDSFILIMKSSVLRAAVRKMFTTRTSRNS